MNFKTKNMRSVFLVFVYAIFYSAVIAKTAAYQGSTPAHADVRKFLEISMTDSIDFIIWTIDFNHNKYALECRYGLSQPSTPGFRNERKAAFSGKFSRQGSYYELQNGNKILYILEVNANLLHLLDRDKQMLRGNGGYSYTLNLETPQATKSFVPSIKNYRFEPTMVFEGRTPCQELAKMMGLTKSAACEKMKWYIIFYSDPQTKQATYYLEGGMGYKKETMAKGKWEKLVDKEGRTIFKLDPDKRFNVYLVRADENILFFTDSLGTPLVGNRYFSYTLNRTYER